MGEMEANTKEDNQLLSRKIAKILDEAKASNAIHIRKLKELSAVRSKSQSPPLFSVAFFRTLTPLFLIQRRTASSERIVRFVSAFASAHCDHFLEELLKFLLKAAVAANKTARFRACQLISEIIMRLPDDAEVSDEVWDEVIEGMKSRVVDKVPIVRTYAVRALSRFANDTENSDILELFVEVLSLEQNVDVRKTILLALPPSSTTSQVVIDCTTDVSESVRKAAYYVLANKFPLQSLSIKQRTVILQRGLADRSAAVSKECLKLMKDEWLSKCCNNDPVELLKYLDVETYESVGESVMAAVLKEGLVKLSGDRSIQQYISSTCENEESVETSASIHLMEPEIALYWKTLCRHFQTEAQAKGSDAAGTMGTEAAVYAAEASDNNDILERILPATAFDYVNLVKAHIDAGANYRFASRQLLLLGAMLDFSDATSRKVAGSFVQELLCKPLDYETDDEGTNIVIGDGINLGGDREWADAVSSLAIKVHAANGEFEEVILRVVEEVAQPCRERTADFIQWMHCFAVTGLLLENAKSFRSLEGKAMEPTEILHSLLLPGAKHVHLDVQRVAIRCLGLFGLLERNPSEEILKQLKLSFARGPAAISTMACKALIDLGMWHGPQQIDRAMSKDHTSYPQDGNSAIENFSSGNGNSKIGWLDLLCSGFEQTDSGQCLENDENESVEVVLGEGFAKILLLSENYPSVSPASHPLLLAKLINQYFSNESKDTTRLKQCLSVFFEHYPSLSANHKKCLSKAFIPVMHSMWPGINGNAGGSATVVSNLRKRAVQASRFMLQMMQAPLYAKQTEVEAESGSTELQETADIFVQDSLECGEEGLALRIASEVVRFNGKRTSAERAYISALCRILVQLNFRIPEQHAIKLMRLLLNRVAECVSAEKELLKELNQMSRRIKSVDSQPEEKLSQEQANIILRSLELDIDLDVESPAESLKTPAPHQRSTRPPRSRRQVRCEEEASSDEETSPAIAQATSIATATRSQRASKTAALSKMTASRNVKIDEHDEDSEEESEVTSDEASDDSE